MSLQTNIILQNLKQTITCAIAQLLNFQKKKKMNELKMGLKQQKLKV